jgi:hypothetical protein
MEIANIQYKKTYKDAPPKTALYTSFGMSPNPKGMQKYHLFILRIEVNGITF